MAQQHDVSTAGMTDAEHEAYQDQLEYLDRLDDNQLATRAEEAKAKLEDEAMILRVAKDLMAARGVAFGQ